MEWLEIGFQCTDRGKVRDARRHREDKTQKRHEVGPKLELVRTQDWVKIKYRKRIRIGK